jgi:hypothetical protein
MLNLTRLRGRALVLELADGRRINVGIKRAGESGKVFLLIDVPDDVTIVRDDSWPFPRPTDS